MPRWFSDVVFIPNVQLSAVSQWVTHLSVCLGSTNMVYSDYVKQSILFSGCARACGNPLAPAWLSGRPEDSSFNVKTTTFANKISQIVSHLVKHPFM